MSMPKLDEDTIDDLLYAARVDDVKFLDVTIAEICQKHALSKVEAISASADLVSGNTAFHMAAANGHTGEQDHIKASW